MRALAATALLVAAAGCARNVTPPTRQAQGNVPGAPEKMPRNAPPADFEDPYLFGMFPDGTHDNAEELTTPRGDETKSPEASNPPATEFPLSEAQLMNPEMAATEPANSPADTKESV